MSEPLSAVKLKKQVIAIRAAHRGIPQAAFTASSAYNEIQLNLYAMILAIAEKLVTHERDLNDLSVSVVEHDEQLAALASEFTPSVPILESLLRHLVNVDELISNVRAMSKAQMEAIPDPKAKEELGKAQVELAALGDANAQAIANVKQLIEESQEEPEDEPEEPEDEPGDDNDADDADEGDADEDEDE